MSFSFGQFFHFESDGLRTEILSCRPSNTAEVYFDQFEVIDILKLGKDALVQIGSHIEITGSAI